MEKELVRIRDTNHLPTFQDEELPDMNMLASLQRNVNDVDLMTKLAKKGPRSKSTDPHLNSPVDVFYRQVPYEETKEKPIMENHKRWSTICRQTEMSQQEMMNSYRLLMNDHLRLERFLSIMTRDHEMARNRLESDLLDAMMCIEDLKQALEVKMARRRKVDPREAEERRYLIRQNKKLLNQLYDSAKKIESLELTKLEMKEQLDLLDFQMVEVENQKNQAEIELKQKIKITMDTAVQTTESANDHSDSIEQLQGKVNSLKMELAEMHKNAIQAKAKICNLQRENNDLKEQIVRIEDSENSLVESDKHLVNSKAQAAKDHLPPNGQTPDLNAQNDLISSLNRQIEELKDALYVQKKKEYSREEREITPTCNQNETLVKVPSTNHYVNIEDKLLKQVINTYQIMLDERDDQIKHCLQRTSTSSSQSDMLTSAASSCSALLGTGSSSQGRQHSIVSLPSSSADNHCTQVSVQTQQEDEELTHIRERYKATALFLTRPELDELLNELTSNTHAGTIAADGQVSFPEILGYVRLLKTLNKCNEVTEELYENGDTIVARKKMEYLQKKLEELILENIKLRRQAFKPLTETSFSSFGFSDESDGTAVGRRVSDDKTAGYFGEQMDHLKKATNVESLKSFIVIAERRRIDLEKIIEDMAQSMNRLKNEVQMSTTELQASRRTEANLRRRLISAMESSGRSLSFDKPANNQRYSQIQSFYGASSSNTEDNYEYSSSPNSANEMANTETNDINQLKIQNHQLENQIVCLNEKIKLDVGKISDQCVRIANLEADNRSLIDRINTIQATEAATQKGIVKLQVLYEDMLREYSECQARNWQEIEAPPTRSSSKTRLSKNSGSQAEINKLKKKIDQMEKQSLNKPPCESKVCADVRGLLKAFQTRFIDTADRLTETQQKLDNLQNILSQDAKNSTLLGAINSNDFASTVCKQIHDLLSEAKEATMKENVDECQRLLSTLLAWVNEREAIVKTNELQLQSKIIQLYNANVNQLNESTGTI